MVMCRAMVPVVNKLVDSLRSGVDMAVFDDTVEKLNLTCFLVQSEIDFRKKQLAATAVEHEELDVDSLTRSYENELQAADVSAFADVMAEQVMFFSRGGARKEN